MKTMLTLALFGCFLILTETVIIAEKDKAVLITGATSGIGRAAAERIAANGYHVYAGARKDQDIKELNAIANITAVRLDVTKQDDIDAAVEFINKQGRGLWGLVNNAGVNVVTPLIKAKEADFRFLYDVNVFGVYKVTRAFAPMIMESKGRIINISSISGVLSGPGYGMYASSKHAIEAMTDALSDELRDFGVHVAAVNPGNFASEIGLTRCKRLIATEDEDNWEEFEERRQRMINGCKERLKEGVKGEGTPPDAVAKTIEQSLFEDNPRDRYLIVPEQREAGWTISWGLEEVLRFNNNHEYSYTRDELVEYIDKIWPYHSGEKSFDNEKDMKELMDFMQTWMTRGAEKPEDAE